MVLRFAWRFYLSILYDVITFFFYLPGFVPHTLLELSELTE
jgi:hypothetical protein